MAIINETQRLFLRGEVTNFTVNFFADAALTMPLTPLDASQYPAYTIYDINNEVVQSGIGVADTTPGRYRADFIVPTDAPLTNDISRWRIEWTMVATDSRQVDFVEEFDVRDTVLTASETREQKFITLMGEDYRAIIRLPEVPVEIFVDVYLLGSTTKIVDNVGLGLGGIQQSIDGDCIVYYYDITGSDFGVSCFFSVIWKIRNTSIEPFNFLYQSLTVISPTTLNLVTCLRMLIDKFQKRLGTVQALEDSDLVEYLVRGSELVNSSYPTSFFGFNTMPQSLTVFHLLLSAWYGLQAQRLLEIDLGFSFSGQTVTLDYDHQSGIADVASTWSDFIKENLTAAKMSILRRNTPVGSVAGRSYRYSDINTFTYKIASLHGGTNNILSQLTTLGLLF